MVKECFGMPEKSLLILKGKNEEQPFFVTKQWLKRVTLMQKRILFFCTVQTAECGFAICCRGQIIDGFKKDKTGH